MSMFDIFGAIMFLLGIGSIVDLAANPKESRGKVDVIWHVVTIGWLVVTMLSWLHK